MFMNFRVHSFKVSTSASDLEGVNHVLKAKSPGNQIKIELPWDMGTP